MYKLWLEPGGGGYLVWKRVPTVVRPRKSCGCRKVQRLKMGGCQIITSSKRGAVTVLNVNKLHQITVADLKGLSLGFYEKRGL